MTTSLLSLFLLAAITAGASDKPAARPDAGPHHRVHTRVVQRPGADGRMVREESSYTELATGLNVLGADGQYVPSNPEFEFVQGGVQAVRTAHHLKLPARMGGAFGVEIVTPDGQTVRCHPLAIAAFDPVSGKREFLAVVADAQGWLVDPQTVVYSNCFSGLRASIRFYNGRAGVASDLLLYEIPDLAALGMPEGRLELWTEWEETPPFAQKTTKVLHGEADPARRARMQSPDVTDQTLGVGAMELMPGKAFPGGVRSNGLAPVAGGLRVGKTSFMVEGRRFLVETVQHGALVQMLGRANNHAPLQAAALHRTLNVPARPVRAAQRPGASGPDTERTRVVASAGDISTCDQDRTLATLDWELGNASFTNLTLEATTTYLVNGAAFLYGTTRIEGGTVVKYAGSNSSSFVYIAGDVVCDTSPYLPAVFTSATDNSIGSQLTMNSTPTNYYAAIFIATSGRELNHIRIAYADYALVAEGDVRVSHSQFLHCGNGIQPGYGGTANVRNVLFQDMAKIFYGYQYQGVGVNLTVNRCAALAWDSEDEGGHSIRLTNCVLNQVALGIEDVTRDHTAWEDAAQGVFETVGGGGHYLAAGSTNRDAGTTAIDTNLLADLRARTTDAPLWLSGNQTQDAILASRALADTGTLDLGYHYGPLDYVVSDWILRPGVTAVLTNGAVLAISYSSSSNGTFGVMLDDAKFVSEGTATRKNRICQAHVSQETGGFPGGSCMFRDGWASGVSTNASSQARFRFTTSERMAEYDYILGASGGFTALEWSHCNLLGAFIGADFSGGPPLVFGVTNCLVDWVYWQIIAYDEQTNKSVVLQNNLFKRSNLQLEPGTHPWQARDNLFDTTSVDTGFSEPMLARSNALYASSAPDNWTNQIILTNLVYQTGPLGTNYLGGNATLVNQGSQLASQAGLYHFTTSTNQAKEANSVVDSGLHYVAVNSAGQPLDTDGDGIPDYLEDFNGNGEVNSGETDWASAADQGLRVLICRPKNGSVLP